MFQQLMRTEDCYAFMIKFVEELADGKTLDVSVPSVELRDFIQQSIAKNYNHFALTCWYECVYAQTEGLISFAWLCAYEKFKWKKSETLKAHSKRFKKLLCDTLYIHTQSVEFVQRIPLDEPVEDVIEIDFSRVSSDGPEKGTIWQNLGGEFFVIGIPDRLFQSQSEALGAAKRLLKSLRAS